MVNALKSFSDSWIEICNKSLQHSAGFLSFFLSHFILIDSFMYVCKKKKNEYKYYRILYRKKFFQFS